MQQALYNTVRAQNTNLTIITTAAAPAVPARPSRLVRWVACRWGMVGVLTLMAASAAYGACALAHLGL